MSNKINSEDLSEAILREMEKYVTATEEELKKIAQEVAKEGVKKLKKISPRGNGSRKGNYADEWSVKAVSNRNGQFSFVIYNRKKPGLTHLLEKGHQLASGGRTRAIPHIKPVEEWCKEEYERRVKEMLRE